MVRTSIRPLARLLMAAFLSFIAMTDAVHAAPQGDTAMLKVATHEAPPFVMRDDDGEWHGLAIDLWRDVATDMGLRFELEPVDLDNMVSGVADGRYAMSVGALTVTPGREEQIDFTHPYLTTGFGIAVREAPASWWLLMRGFMSWGFLQAVMALAGLLAVVGLLFWVAERRHNSEEFGGQPMSGIGSGFWFSAVTMTTVGYGDKAPRTPLGKLIALVWMFAAIIIISTFTGMIASALTEGRLAGQVTGASDLPKVRVGTVGASAAQEWLRGDDIGPRIYADVDAGLAALEAKEIDAFVYDLPLLSYRLRNGANSALRLVPGSFGRQDYAFALPQESGIREEMNVALLRRIEDAQWSSELRKVLGRE